MDLSHLRRDYIKGGLHKDDLPAYPMELFAQWLEQARETESLDPTAMIVATVAASGQPSQRTVLLKYYDENGFVFFTNYGSRKAAEIKENAQVSLLFLWLQLERQIIITGTAEKISTMESAKYFLTRPRESQLAAWVSSQSKPLSSRQALMQKLAEMKNKMEEKQVPLPSFWGGYRVRPQTIEFWQGGESRLHDRFLYSRGSQKEQMWEIERLNP